MELFTRNDMYKLGIILLQFIGENFKYTQSKLVLYRCFNYMAFITLAIFAVVNFLYVDSGLYVTTMQFLLSVVHVLIKYSLFIYYKSDIAFVLNISSKYFWTGDEFNGTVSKTLAVRYKTVQFVQRGTLGVLTVGILIYCLRPVFLSDATIILQVWIFIDSSLIAGIVVLCYYYYFSLIIFVLLGYDFIYISMCMDVVCQMELLNFRINQALSNNVANVMLELGTCVRHHQIMLSVFRRMRNIYSPVLLFHYFLTLIGTCTSIYEFRRKVDVPNFVLNIIATSFSYLQFGCYTFPAEQVAVEFLNLSQCSYVSKWYEYSTSVQKLVLFMIAKSQKEICFRGGGIMNINADAFGSVVRKTYTFYALLQNQFKK